MTQSNDQDWPPAPLIPPGRGVKTTKSNLELRALNVNIRYTSMPLWGYDFVAMLLKNIFKKSGFKILGNWKLDDLLKGPTPRSLTFVGGLVRPGMLAATSSETIDSPHLG